MKTNRNVIALDADQIARRAPSVFATEAHDSRSERYAYIPTAQIISRLADEGFICTDAQQKRTRTEERAGFTKHLLRFSRRDAVLVDGVVPQVLLINSYDGSSRYKLLGGFWRFVCANGLIIGQSFEEVSIPHTGDVIGRVIEGTYRVIEGTDRAGSVAADWRGISLSADESNAYATAALQLRWDGTEHPAPIQADAALRVRREDDRGSDLWNTYNRVQENLVKGGQRTYSAAGRRLRVRGVNGIDGNVALNRALWTLTEALANLKRAA
jgi:hypothetical protein